MPGTMPGIPGAPNMGGGCIACCIAACASVPKIACRSGNRNNRNVCSKNARAACRFPPSICPTAGHIWVS